MSGPRESVRRRASSFRRRVHLVLEAGHAAGTVGTVFEGSLIALIIANVVAFTLESVPDIRAAHLVFFRAFEIVSVAAFTVEFCLRLWAAPEDPRVAPSGPVLGRLRYAARPLMIVDFLAIAPAYVALIVPFTDFRILRLFRLLRLLKIARYSPALGTLIHVITAERRALLGTLLLLLSVMCFSATAMHLAEGGLRPDVFGTIPDCMWWAIATLTTVGYGDVVPITALGRIVAAITMITGLGLFALPVGIIATGFVDEIHRRDFVVTWSMLARVPLFEGFDVHTIGEIMGLLRSQVVGAGAIIAAEGDTADAMYFVVSGDAEAHLPRGNLHLGPGDFFGELALLYTPPRSTTVIAHMRCQLLALSAKDFAHLMRKHPELKQRLEKAAAERLRGAWGSGDIATVEVKEATRPKPPAQG